MEFDEIVMVDWSASATPTRRQENSIWIARRTSDERASAENYSTRLAALEALHSLVENRDGRLLIGFDFAFGFPEGFYRSFYKVRMEHDSATGPRPLLEWIAARAEVDPRSPDNDNKRFELAAEINGLLNPQMPGPFWGARKDATPDVRDVVPPGHVGLFSWPYHAAGDEFDRWRAVDDLLRDELKESPLSVFQLGNGPSVGSQTLTGIPAIIELSASDDVGIWPFDTGFRSDRFDVVIVEIWPRLATWEVMSRSLWSSTDERQVRAMAELCWGLAMSGRLSDVLAGIHLTENQRRRALIEGWIFGAELGRTCPRCLFGAGLSGAALS